MIDVLYLCPLVGQSKRFGWADESLEVARFDRGGMSPAWRELATLLARYEGDDLCIVAAKMARFTQPGLDLLNWLAPHNVNIVQVPATSWGFKHWLVRLSNVVECVGAAGLRHGNYTPGWIEHPQATCLHGIDPSYEGFGLCL